MADNTVYRVTEIVGSSDQNIDHAVRGALERAREALPHLDWFEVVSIRGSVDNPSESPTYQVTLKVGHRLRQPQDD